MFEQVGFWIIQGPGWFLFAYLVLAQCVAAFSYDLGIRMGTQESSEQVTQVGVAMFWGFAFTDLVFYTPLLGVGLVAHCVGTNWAVAALAAALGATVYWPITCLATVWKARDAEGWSLPKESQYWVVLPIIASWATVALVLVAAGF